MAARAGSGKKRSTRSAREHKAREGDWSSTQEVYGADLWHDCQKVGPTVIKNSKNKIKK